MIYFISPTKIFKWIEGLTSFISSIFFVILIIGLTFALIISPPDYLQGDSVRIMYVHVPSAWISLASFTCIALLSFFTFLAKVKNLNLICKSIAPIGLLFTSLAIITGSLWGKPTWGTWWAWDQTYFYVSVTIILHLIYFLF